MSSNRLGELLVRNGLITDDQLSKALGEQQSSGGRLGSSLVKLGFISEDELSAFLSKQYGVPSVNLNLNVRGLDSSSTLAINERSDAMLAEGRSVYKLGLGQSPFPVPDPVVESLRAHAHEKDYLPVQGLPALRDAVAGDSGRAPAVRVAAGDSVVARRSPEPRGT